MARCEEEEGQTMMVNEEQRRHDIDDETPERRQLARALYERADAAAHRLVRARVFDRDTNIARWYNLLDEDDQINGSQIGRAVGDRRVIDRMRSGSIPSSRLIGKLAELFGEPASEWYEIAGYPLPADVFLADLDSPTRSVIKMMMDLATEEERAAFAEDARAVARRRRPDLNEN